jgi:hypothetical protein
MAVAKSISDAFFDATSALATLRSALKKLRKSIEKDVAAKSGKKVKAKAVVKTTTKATAKATAKARAAPAIPAASSLRPPPPPRATSTSLGLVPICDAACEDDRRNACVTWLTNGLEAVEDEVLSARNRLLRDQGVSGSEASG